jgi:hypothetical protein
MTVRRETAVIAFNDCYSLCGGALVVSELALWFCKKTAV